MKFKNVKHALNWYVHKKANPTGANSLIGLGLEGQGSGYNPNDLTWTDYVHTIVDIENILDQFTPFVRKLLLTYGVYDKEAAMNLLTSTSDLHRSRTTSWRFLSRQIRQFKRLLDDNDYIEEYQKLENLVLAA